MFSSTIILTAVFQLIGAGLIFGLLIWLIDFCKVPEPFNWVLRVVLAIAAVMVCIGVILSLANGQPLFRA